MFRKSFLLFMVSVLILAVTPAFAAYPDKAITMIVPFGAGGSTDVPARFLANMLEKKLGQSVVVQNITGAGGTQGIAQVFNAKPDGYTIGYTSIGVVSLQPHVQNIPFGRDSFDFIGMVTQQPVVIMSSKKAPWKNFAEMVTEVKANPNKYIVAITSTGNITHIPVVEMAEHFDLKFRYIPYRTTPEIMKDMLTGRVHLHADNPVPLSQFDINGLVQFSDARVEGLDFPTSKETGFDRMFTHWQGVIAPKGLPKDVEQKLAKAVEEIVQSPEFKEQMKKVSTRARWMGPVEFKKHFQEEFDMYGKVLKELKPKK